MALMVLIMIDTPEAVKSITAVLPYYPASDRQEVSRVPITARLVADLLVTAGVMSCDG